MDRRGFLKLVPKMAGASAVTLVAPTVLLPAQEEPLKVEEVEAPPPEDTQVSQFQKVANEIVDTVNGRMKSMSEDEMRERAGQSLAEYLKRYA